MYMMESLALFFLLFIMHCQSQSGEKIQQIETNQANEKERFSVVCGGVKAALSLSQCLDNCDDECHGKENV